MNSVMAYHSGRGSEMRRVISYRSKSDGSHHARSKLQFKAPGVLVDYRIVKLSVRQRGSLTFPNPRTQPAISAKNDGYIPLLVQILELMTCLDTY